MILDVRNEFQEIYYIFDEQKNKVV